MLVYTQAMLSFLLFRPEPRNVLMIGLGSASLVRFFRHEMPDAHLTVIEINRDVIQVAHQFFRLPQDDDRLDVQVGNGVHLRAANASCDSTRSWSTATIIARAPGKLESAEFYEACRARLAPQGALVANVFGRVRGHGQTKRHLREIFGDGVVLLPSSDSKNVLVTAFADPPAPVSAAQLRNRAAELKERYDLPFGKWVHALQRANSAGRAALFR